MTKLKLSLDDLRIDSFMTAPEELDAVHAHSATNQSCACGPTWDPCASQFDCTSNGTCQIQLTDCAWDC